MSRTSLNFLLDTLLLVIFAALVFSGVIVRFVFPPASDARGWLLWGLSYDQWSTIQFAIIAIMTLAVLVHAVRRRPLAADGARRGAQSSRGLEVLEA